MAVGNTSEWLEDLRTKGQLHDWVEIEHLDVLDVLPENSSDLR